MYRASPDELRDYLDAHPNLNVNYDLFLEMGNTLTDAKLGSSGLSNGILKMIELNLAAHFAVLSIEKGGITRQKAGESEEGYRQDFSSRPNLSMTRFGQQAVMLDTTGVLNSMNAPGGSAEFRVM
jgi:hypothetical protein